MIFWCVCVCVCVCVGVVLDFTYSNFSLYVCVNVCPEIFCVCVVVWFEIYR